jgi:hypothetical protein
MFVEGNIMSGNEMKTWRRIAILVLMLGGGLGVPVYGFAGGTGEPNNPYQIATVTDLLSINANPDLLKKSYVLINDLDLDPNLPGGRLFDNAVIGRDNDPKVSGSSGTAFSGVFDGQGHTIRRLCLSGSPGHNAGLFAYSRGLIKDLHLKDVQVSGSPCGALAGVTPEGMILRCSVTGRVTGTEQVGGLIGNAWNAMVLHCESQADVSAGSDVGGLVGHALNGVQIADCRASGTVTGAGSVGGLIGSTIGGVILRCTAAGEVTGTDEVGGLIGVAWDSALLGCESRANVSANSKVGGLAGHIHTRAQVADCRATGTVAGVKSVGGLIGSSDQSTIHRCAALCEVTATEAAAGLTGEIFLGTSIADCYAQGSVAGSIIGGLVGDAMTSGFPTRIVNCYAACEMLGLPGGTKSPVVGGLLGSRKGLYEAFTAIGCFWDTERSTIQLGAGVGPAYYGTGLTTKQTLSLHKSDGSGRCGDLTEDV